VRFGFGVAAIGLSLVLRAGVAAAQTPSLGEIAKKEAERRKAQPPAGKVYTNKDLPTGAQTLPPAAAAPPPAEVLPEPTPAAEGQKPEEQKGEEKNEAWWKERIGTAREELRRNEMFAEALQSRINALSRDFVARDNPVQRARIGQDRADAVTELARVKSEIDKGKKQIEDIEEEARKSSVPPGWLR
jgi:hypothetical protein